MKRILITISLILALSLPALAENKPSAINGFDGLKWGTSKSSVSGKMIKTDTGDSIIKVKVENDNFLGGRIAGKQYVFLNDYGLCGGFVEIRTSHFKNDKINRTDWEDKVRATLADKYGTYPPNRIDYNRWLTTDGEIIFAKDGSIYRIIYRSQKMLDQDISKYRTEISEAYKSGEIGDFKF